IAKDKTEVNIDEYGDNCFYFNIKTNDKVIEHLKFPVQGDYQRMNIATAYAAMEIISRDEGFELTDKIVKKGFTNLIPNSLFHGRFQLIRHKPKVILDVSHNPQALSNLKESLKNVERSKLYILFGLLKDKDHKACIEIMEKLDAEIILTKPDYKRAAEPVMLYELAGSKDKFTLKRDFTEAVDYIKEKLNKDDLLLVTGSFFMVSDFMRLVNKYY